LEETVTPDSLADNEIDCRNISSSGSKPRPAAASGAEDDMMVVAVVVVMKVEERFEFREGRGQSSSDTICL
jgi:hypothetical protein